MPDTRLIHSKVEFDYDANCYHACEVIVLNIKIKSKDNYFLFRIDSACRLFGHTENALKSAKEIFFYNLEKLIDKCFENNVEEELQETFIFNKLKNSSNFLCKLNEKSYSIYIKYCSQHVIALQ